MVRKADASLLLETFSAVSLTAKKVGQGLLNFQKQGLRHVATRRATSRVHQKVDCTFSKRPMAPPSLAPGHEGQNARSENSPTARGDGYSDCPKMRSNAAAIGSGIENPDARNV